jgi:hypothetical protein
MLNTLTHTNLLERLQMQSIAKPQRLLLLPLQSSTMGGGVSAIPQIDKRGQSAIALAKCEHSLRNAAHHPS